MTRRLTAIAGLLALTFASGCSRTLTPANVEYDQSISPYHVVKRGESIAGIAKKYGLNKTELMRLNGLKTPRLVIGQKILVRQSQTALSQTRNIDPYEAPASEGGNMGDIKVNRLTPLDAQEGPETLREDVQPFGQTNAMDKNDEIEIIKEELPKERETTAEMPLSAGTYAWPVDGGTKGIIKDFSRGGNDGLNIRAPKGTPVKAANNGVVAHAGNQLRGFGNVVLIKHENGYMSVYAHLDEVSVKRNDTIKAGQKIGTVGKSGNVKEPQLHFEIRKGTTPIDPKNLLG